MMKDNNPDYISGYYDAVRDVLELLENRCNKESDRLEDAQQAYVLGVLEDVEDDVMELYKK